MFRRDVHKDVERSKGHLSPKILNELSKQVSAVADGLIDSGYKVRPYLSFLIRFCFIVFSHRLVRSLTL